MSDKGDKICPLCTEEMDLTDQQLKPCKCGYEICVWCWNHIMGMAEKDNTEGRCPACRTPYDKEKIVGMAANCERLVAEMSSERKLKSQKLKPKTSEGRMHLSNVRVIQRNLVYIIGLPLNLADEAVLQRKEYFGQYGKVLKVSISRTATGVIQHSANNSCCVYITYAKEEEAVRCIQSVHSYVLEGRSLRACFGTTKYCHAWLKNMPCTIPDCLYLHDFGSQEDSFTKDDLVSAFTRSRVQQVIGATNNLHRRSGNVLPRPVDEYTNRNIPTMAKPHSDKFSNQNIGNFDTGSCADSGTGRANALPGAASWVMRVSLPPVASVSGSGRSPNHSPEALNDPQGFPSDTVSNKSCSDMKRTMIPEGSGGGHPSFLMPSDNLPCLSASHDISGGITSPASGASSLDLSESSFAPGLHEDEYFHTDGDIQGLCSELSPISIGNHHKEEYSDPFLQGSGNSNHKVPGSQGSQQDGRGQFHELLTSPAPRETVNAEDLLSFDDQQFKAFGGTNHLPSMLSSEQNLTQSSYQSWEHEVNCRNSTDVHPSVAPIKHDGIAFPMACSNSLLSNGFHDNWDNGFTQLDGKSHYSNSSPKVGLGKCLKECDHNVVNDNGQAVDKGESSIISNILSMDFEAWEDFSLTSFQGLVEMFTESDERHNFLKTRSFRKLQDSNQSRFSFARQDDFLNQASNVDSCFENEMSKSLASNYFMENKDVYADRYHDISLKNGSVGSNGFHGSHSFSSSKFSVPKAPTSQPSGIAVSGRAVPPGFPSQGAQPPAFDYAANHLLQNSLPPSRNVGVGSYRDVEFIDPAMMEVHKGNVTRRLNSPFGMGPASSSRLSPLDHGIELQMMMQQSIPSQQNPRFPDHFRNMFSSSNDNYGNSPRLLGQSPPNNPTVHAEVTAQPIGNLHMPNGHWGGWNEMKSIGDIGAAELITNGRMGFTKFIPNYENLQYQMSSSSNLYSRGFAM